MKRIFCTVTTDLNYDQRMNRICSSLVKAGYDVTLIGREKKSSDPLIERPFHQHRIKCWFETSILFYAEYNIRLFFYLLKQRFDVISAIDLDTILPCYAVSRIKNRPITYDAHEYFTEQEEIVDRPLIKWFWKSIERITVPNIKNGYTVSRGYADMFEKEYGVKYKLVRNVTVLKELSTPEKNGQLPYILYQGAVNHGRGLEVLVEAMKNIDSHQLYICGNGDIFEDLQVLSQKLGVDHKIKFWGYVQPEELRKYTLGASIGITFFANAGLSHKFSLANRFFDYMHAGVPQIAMKYPEYIHFNTQHEVAYLMPELNVEEATKALTKIIEDKDYQEKLKANALEAREKHNWQQDEKTLVSVYKGMNL